MSDSNLQDKPEGIRLQLFMAKAGVASRRASESIIESGRVSVNGKVVTTLGTKVTAADTVCLDGKPLKIQNTMRYVLLNKPAGYVCSSADEKGRQIALDLLAPHFSERLYNVGRLDMFSCGLIIFTNDGGLAAKISHPSAQLEKEYIIDTSTPIPDELIERFKKGIRVDGVFYKCQDAEKLSSRKVRIVLIEGKNREIRRVFDKFEIGIKRLERVRIGAIKIGDLSEGDFRELTELELQFLRNL